MVVDLGAAIAVGSLVFAAGGAWINVKATARSARSQGRRIGELEDRTAYVEGTLHIRRQALPDGGVAVTRPDDPPDDET